MSGVEIILGLVFTACCVYFNWRGGFRAGFMQGGSALYDIAVEDTINYLITTEQLAPHLKHHINKSLIDSIAREGAKNRGYVKQEVQENA